MFSPFCVCFLVLNILDLVGRRDLAAVTGSETVTLYLCMRWNSVHWCAGVALPCSLFGRWTVQFSFVNVRSWKSCWIEPVKVLLAFTALNCLVSELEPAARFRDWSLLCVILEAQLGHAPEISWFSVEMEWPQSRLFFCIFCLFLV